MNIFSKCANTLSSIFKSILKSIINFFLNFYQGSIATKISYFIMGYGCLAYKQIAKGLIFLGIQISYLFFIFNSGIYFLSMLGSLGLNKQGEVWDEKEEIFRVVQGDNSMLLLLFGVLVIFVSLLIFIIYLWQIKIAIRNENLYKNNKKIPSFKDELKSLLDNNFHYSVLFIPFVLTLLFTVVPLIFMVLIAFTNFDINHQPPGNLFTWIGLENFTRLLGGNQLWGSTFIKLFVWTMIWAVFATFLNYILGMMLAVLINKKGIVLKKMWRTIFVTTIAVPQFVSLLLMAKMLDDQGALNNLLINMNIISSKIPFLSDPLVAKITVIVINLWVGIPYTMLITSGVLMNIPESLYEAGRLDGANPFQQFIHITLPYMLHVTTPYLITQFVGNINNFNVIYLLTGGGPLSLDLYQAGETDLLVTWLYKLTVNEKNYALASAIGIIIFIIVSLISLVVYNNTNAVKKEDDFS